MVTKHLTRAKFGMEIFKFCLCLSIPGIAVGVFRVSVLWSCSSLFLSLCLLHIASRMQA